MFTSEAAFENAVIDVLCDNGWESRVLRYPTEADLIENWAQILFENNRGIDRLNGCPLTEGEMSQVLARVNELRTPLALNGFINGKTITITRDNPDDVAHLGKEVSLKIYDRHEIAAGQSRYQIAQQPQFTKRSDILPERRGDLLLLINGMPVIHLELKRSGVGLTKACNQIIKYSTEGVFTGIFALVQVFVAMTPDDSVYFANPGPEGRFSENYWFHWADFNNEPIKDWPSVTQKLLNIPMAHKLIGFYTVADTDDKALKVMRSYQYWAASRIADRVSQTRWDEPNQRGGFIWHTTGSGKTMTSFKSAQLIANSGDADKVIFLVDRIELGTQSLREYRSFADDAESVQATEHTGALIAKLKSSSPSDTLIVTSIQKMYNVTHERKVRPADLDRIRRKRIVFIVDECHRSTFGEMLASIKETYDRAIFFGFTGTPIHEENQKKKSTTSSIFGDELHRYSIADGIRDGNVLGFDPKLVRIFNDEDLRARVALDKLHATSLDDIRDDPAKLQRYLAIVNDTARFPMAKPHESSEIFEWSIEEALPKDQYSTDAFRNGVLDDIRRGWEHRSHDGKFHALLATESIPDAIDYYRRFKQTWPELKVTALFDPNIDNTGNDQLDKEEGLVEIITDYNARYDTDFSLPTHARMKQDMAERLAHKKGYCDIENHPERQIDLLIVVDQMLTGFDSVWINTLYLDKMLHFENIIQAFSRTNRLFGPEKPFGTICYYRLPHTMKENIDAAVKLYSGDRPLALFTSSLDEHLEQVDHAFHEIATLFQAADEPTFTALPEDPKAQQKFASAFRQLTAAMEAARVQGFTWANPEYTVVSSDGEVATLELSFDQRTHEVLVQRHKEYLQIRSVDPNPTDPGDGIDAYDIDAYISQIDTGRIDQEYMDANFTKWLKVLLVEGPEAESLASLRGELHRSFASLNQEQQKFAEIVIRKMESNDLVIHDGWSFMDYVTELEEHAHREVLDRVVRATGVDRAALERILATHPSEGQLDEFGRFQELLSTADLDVFQSFCRAVLGEDIKGRFHLKRRLHEFLKDFIIHDQTPFGTHPDEG